MSNITTIYSRLRTVIPTLISGYNELTNPYDLEDNPYPISAAGWGVTVGAGSLSEFEVYKDDNETREFTIILTRELFRLETDSTLLPAATVTLLEDLRTIKNDLLDFDQIGIEGNIQKIDFVSASGLEFVNGEKFSLITGSLTFNITYSEVI